LNAARDQRPIGGAAEIRPGQAAETGHGAGRGGADQPLTPVQTLPGANRNRHRSTSSNHDDGVPEQFECGPKVLRQVDDVESEGFEPHPEEPPTGPREARPDETKLRQT
jgi:hypothetical protein